MIDFSDLQAAIAADKAAFASADEGENVRGGLIDIADDVSEALGDIEDAINGGVLYELDASLTTEGAGADAKAAGDRFRRIAGMLCPCGSAAQLQTHHIGRVINADGTATANAKWARSGTVGTANVPAVHMAENGEYKFRIAGYNANTYDIKAFLGCMEGDFDGNNIIFPDAWKNVVFCIRRADGEDVAESDWTAASACFEFMKLTDETLTESGKAADAYATGARIAELADAAGVGITCEANTYGANYWARGSIAGGVNTDNSKKLRTVGYVPRETVRIEAPEGYLFFCVAYDKNGYAGKINEDGAISTEGTTAKFRSRSFTPSERAYNFRIVVERADAGTADADTVYGGVVFYTAPEAVQFRTTRNNKTHVAELVAIAESYLNRSSLSYGYTTILEGRNNTSNIDCSALALLALRGYAFENTSYSPDIAKRDPEEWLANPDYDWAICSYDWELPREISRRDTFCDPDPDRDHNPDNNAQYWRKQQRIRLASQMAQWMVERGETVPMDEHLVNLEPGDMLFYARKDPTTGDWVHPDRFMRVNHVAMCVSKERATDDGEWDIVKYPYKHMMIESAVCEHGVRERCVEDGPEDPADTYTTNNINTLVLICRPDLGSI